MEDGERGDKSNKFFHPLPLGGHAFAPPVYVPTDEEQPRLLRRLMPLLVVVCAAGLGGLGVWLAVVFSQPASEKPTAEKSAAHAAASAGAPSVALGALVTRAPQQAHAVRPAKPAALAPAARAPEPASAQPVAAAKPDTQQADARKDDGDKDKGAAADSARDDGASADASDSGRHRHHDHHHSRPSRSERSAAPSSKLPANPSRAAVLSAMNRVQPGVKRCLAGQHGVITASITIVGSSGRVTTANISGQSGAIGSCIAREVRKARFPKFSNESLSVRYPMKF